MACGRLPGATGMVVNSGAGAFSAASSLTAEPTSANSAMEMIDVLFMLLSLPL
jgi:hypothetical protein